MIRILIVEDEITIARLIDLNLSACGYECTCEYDGLAAADLLEQMSFYLILLDIMLPGDDGITLLKRLRSDKRTAQVPVIMATAKGSEFDKVHGLDNGADDYIAKPFGMIDMVSRVKAVLRRYKQDDKLVRLTVGDLVMELDKHRVTAGGQEVVLTFKEFELLHKLLERPGQVFTREQLLTDIWGYDFAGETRTVDVHVRTLRAKLGQAGGLVETVRGVGYRIGAGYEK